MNSTWTIATPSSIRVFMLLRSSMVLSRASSGCTTWRSRSAGVAPGSTATTAKFG